MRTVIAGSLALCFPALAAAAPPPIESFTNFARYQSMKISPGGTYLALTRRTSENEIMTVLGYPDLKVSMQTQFGSLTDVARFEWGSDRRILIEPARRFPGFTDYKARTGELIGIDADGKNAELLFGYAAGMLQTGTRIEQRKSTDAAGEILQRLPGKRDEVLIQTYGYGIEGDFNGAFRMDVRSGKLTKIATSPLRNGTFVIHADQQVALVYGSDAAGSTVVLQRQPGSMEWRDLIKTEQNRGSLWPIATSGVQGEFFALEDRSAPTVGVLAWNPAKASEQVLFRHEDADVTGYSVDPSGKPWVFTYTDHFPDYWYPDPAHLLAQTHQWLRGLFKGHDIAITSQTDDLSIAVAAIASPLTPPLFLVVDVKNRKALQHLPSRPELKSEDLARVEPIEFTARDGLKIRGYLTVPGRGPKTRLPMIVAIHGGPHSVYDSYGFDYETQLLASRGYAVLQVNFRGSGGRGRAFQGAGFGRWGREMQDDITDGVRWAIGDGVADAKRICAYGGSFGAYAALTGAFREPELFRCVIGMAGVYDLPLMFQEGDVPTVQRGVNYLRAAVGTDMEELKRRSPVYNADKIRAAVMLIHGKIDERAPFEHAQRMRDALERAGNKPEWLTEWGEGHGFFDEGNRRAAYERMLAFFEKHLAPGPAQL